MKPIIIENRMTEAEKIERWLQVMKSYCVKLGLPCSTEAELNAAMDYIEANPEPVEFDENGEAICLVI